MNSVFCKLICEPTM